MGCLELEEKLIDYSEGLLEGSELSLVERHLVDCAGCQEELRLLKLSWSSLEAWAPIEPSPLFARSRVGGDSSQPAASQRLCLAGLELESVTGSIPGNGHVGLRTVLLLSSQCVSGDAP